MTTELEKIPKSIQDFAADLCEVCKKHELADFGGSFRLGFNNADRLDWGTVSFVWKTGRHEEEANQIQIIAEQRVNVKIPVTY